MRVAKIVGRVVLGRSHPSFSGARLRLAVPMSLESTAGRCRAFRGIVSAVGRVGGGQWFPRRTERKWRSGPAVSTRA